MVDTNGSSVRIRPQIKMPSTAKNRLSISEIRSGLNSRPSQSRTVMVEAMNPELPPIDTWS